MNPPKLSIAVTTYNHEQFIAQALDSILSQDVDFSFEVVVGEDHSTDNTRKIVEDYKQKHPNIIYLLRQEKNLGYVKNFDLTLKACTGEYICIFDGDDVMLPGKLKKQVALLDAHPEFALVGHNVRAFDSKSGKTNRIIKPNHKRDFYTIEDLIVYGSFFANCSKVFRKKYLPADGIDHSIMVIADWYITLMIVDTHKIGFIHEVLAEYRVHSESIMQKLKGKQDFEDKMFILNKLNKKYDHKYERLFKNQLAYAYMIYGIDEMNSGNARAARNKFIQSLKQKMNYSKSQYFYLFASLLPKFMRGSFLQIKKITHLR